MACHCQVSHSATNIVLYSINQKGKPPRWSKIRVLENSLNVWNFVNHRQYAPLFIKARMTRPTNHLFWNCKASIARY